MKNKAFFCMFLLIFCLFYTFSISSSAIPTTRRHKLTQDADSLTMKIAVKERNQVVEGRMEIESNDYSGAGANNRHDPVTPGGA